MTEPEILAKIVLTADETVVEIPAKLMVHLEKDGLSGEVAKPIPPIVHVHENGNYIVKGACVTDRAALGHMNIPEHETCVEISRSAVMALVGS